MIMRQSSISSSSSSAASPVFCECWINLTIIYFYSWIFIFISSAFLLLHQQLQQHHQLHQFLGAFPQIMIIHYKLHYCVGIGDLLSSLFLCFPSSLVFFLFCKHLWQQVNPYFSLVQLFFSPVTFSKAFLEISLVARLLFRNHFLLVFKFDLTFEIMWICSMLKKWISLKTCSRSYLSDLLDIGNTVISD